jgi:hypothetical protein
VLVRGGVAAGDGRGVGDPVNGAMLNLQFLFPDGDSVMAYDVHPRSQDEPVPLPAGAIGVVLWLGTR